VSRCNPNPNPYCTTKGAQVDDVHAVRKGTVRGCEDDIICVAAVTAEDAIGACTEHESPSACSAVMQSPFITRISSG